MPSITEQKKQWRQWLRQKKSELTSAEQKKFSNKIANTLFSTTHWKQAKTIGLYYSVKDEVQTEEILTQCFMDGKTPCFPVLNQNKLDFYAVDQKTEWMKNIYQIPEPNPKKCQKILIEKMDLILVPLLGFDKDYYRLGQGGGFYDRTLENISKKPLLIGLAFSCQALQKTPKEPWDLRLNTVITE